MIGGVTRRVSPHLSGVPHLHVNRPLELRLIYKNAPKFVANLFRRKFLDLWNDSSNSSIPTTVLDFTIQCNGGSRQSDKGGGGHPNPEIRRRGPVSKTFFFGPQFGLKIKGRPPGPLPWIRHCNEIQDKRFFIVYFMYSHCKIRSIERALVFSWLFAFSRQPIVADKVRAKSRAATSFPGTSPTPGDE